MPFESRAQSRYFRWAKAHPEEAAARGLKPKVVNEFIAAQHGHSLAQLPERVKKAEGGAVKPKVFRW